MRKKRQQQKPPATLDIFTYFSYRNRGYGNVGCENGGYPDEIL
jgi:hypothetical protein